MSKLKYKKDDWLHRLLSLKIAVFLTSLIFQGMRYMTWGERTYKITVTFIFALVFLAFGFSLFVALFFGHVLNYLLNGQFYVTYRYLWSKGIMDRNNLDYFLRLITTISKRWGLRDVLIIGSFCRGSMSVRSDLDIRLFHESGVLPSIRAYWCASYLRFIAITRSFPIDVYCFSNVNFLDKIDPKEVPSTMWFDPEIMSIYGRMMSVKDQLEKMSFKDE